MKKHLSLLLSLSLSLSQLVAAQSVQKDQRVVVGTNEVQLDIIAKDKKGRVIRDLKPTDFEIYEDGVKQQVDSFRLMTRNTPAATRVAEGTNEGAKPSTPVKPEPPVTRDIETSISAVALVFDRLSLDARRRAHDSAMSYLGESPTQESYIAVYSIDLGLTTLQNYTVQTDLIKRALDRAGSITSAAFDPTNVYSSSATQNLLQTQAAAASAA